MQAMLLSILFIPAAPVPKEAQPDRDAALKILIECAKTDSPHIREQTIRAMGTLRNRKAIPELQKLLDDPEPTYRLKAIAALIELDGVDDLMLAQLAELEERQKTEAANPGGPEVILFHGVFAKCAEFPQYAVKLAPFLRRQYRFAQGTDFTDSLSAAYAPHAFSFPGELEATRKRVQSYRQSTITESQRKDVVFFARTLRYVGYPPKAALAELERWSQFGCNIFSMILFETMLRFDPENSVVAESLEMNQRYFSLDHPMSQYTLAQMMVLARHNPKALARLTVVAFSPDAANRSTFITSAAMIETLGGLGPAAYPCIDQLIRFTQIPDTKIAALGALVRLKPELREKFLPELIGAFGREDFRGDIRKIETIAIPSPKWIGELEKALSDWPAEDVRKQSVAKTLAAIDSENKVLLKWIEDRLAIWKKNSSDVPGAERLSLMAAIKTLGPKAKKLVPLLLDVLTDADMTLPDPEVAAAIAAATR